MIGIEMDLRNEKHATIATEIDEGKSSVSLTTGQCRSFYSLMNIRRVSISYVSNVN